MEFKLSKSGLFLQRLPKFSAVHASNLTANVSSSLFVTTPMSLDLEMTLDNVPHDVRKNLDNKRLMFLKYYREDSNLLGNQLWDKEFTDRITTEFLHFLLKKMTFSMRQWRWRDVVR